MLRGNTSTQMWTPTRRRIQEEREENPSMEKNSDEEDDHDLTHGKLVETEEAWMTRVSRQR